AGDRIDHRARPASPRSCRTCERLSGAQRGTLTPATSALIPSSGVGSGCIAAMSNTDIEIVVEDPTAPEADSPAVASVRAVDVIVSLLLLALAVTLGYNNWRTGAGWESTGPQGGYFPFYLS